LVIVEESTNYPTILGPKNVPRRMQWGAGRIINNLPSVIAAGMDRSFLPQILLQRGPLERLARHPLLRRGEIRGDELSPAVDYDTQLHNIIHVQTQKNIPQPWGPREWYPGAMIQTLPSVIQTGGGVAGPSRTMHPKIVSTGLSVEM